MMKYIFDSFVVGLFLSPALILMADASMGAYIASMVYVLSVIRIEHIPKVKNWVEKHFDYIKE